VFSAMRDAHIGVNVHYVPIHLQPYYAAMGFSPGAFPVAEHYYQHALSLPLFPSMTAAQQQRVVGVLRTAIDN
jgi:dTDP-4-amino-4,6-dideoxygalactose transaminase